MSMKTWNKKKIKFWKLNYYDIIKFKINMVIKCQN